MLRQQAQQPLLRPGQLQRDTVPGVGHLLEVKGKGGQLQHGSAGVGAAQQVVYPGTQDRQGEGLGHIVVCPQLQTGDLVQLQVVGGENEHRQSGAGPQAAEQLQAAAVREVQVQHHQGKGPLLQGPLPLVQGGRLDKPPPLSLQAQPDALAEGTVILYDQNVIHTVRPLFAPQSAAGLISAIIPRAFRWDKGGSPAEGRNGPEEKSVKLA